MDNMKCTGIYRIKNRINGMSYIGSTKRNFAHRKRQHINYLKNGNHVNCHLQRAWNKYGEEYFTFEILAIIEKDVAYLFEERLLISLSLPNEQYYNQVVAVGHPMHTQPIVHRRASQKGYANSIGLFTPEKRRDVGRKGYASGPGQWTPEQIRENCIKASKYHWHDKSAEYRKDHGKRCWGNQTKENTYRFLTTNHNRWHRDRNYFNNNCRYCWEDMFSQSGL